MLTQFFNWMGIALQEAEKAFQEGEFPVGAVVIDGNRVIGKGHNRVEGLQDPTAHAEVLAITAACNFREEWRLNNCILISTLEPCPMCAGAILNARIPMVIFGSYDPQYGACESVYSLLTDGIANHRSKVIGGIRQDECDELLQRFLKRIRGQER